MNRYLLGFLYPISRLISYSVFEKVRKIMSALVQWWYFIHINYSKWLSHIYYFKSEMRKPLSAPAYLFYVHKIPGTEDKRRSLHDGFERWDISPVLVYCIFFAGKCSLSYLFCHSLSLVCIERDNAFLPIHVVTYMWSDINQEWTISARSTSRAGVEMASRFF